MIPAFLLLTQLVLGATLMWCSFCRLVKTDRETMREVRWSFIFQMIAGGLVFGAPVMPELMREATWEPWTTPYWVWIVLLASYSFIQLTTAVHWASGKVPTLFQRRREGDKPTPFFNGWPMAVVSVAVVLAFLIGPAVAIARAVAGDNWRHVPGDVAFMPPGSESRCGNAAGCIVFTVEGLRSLLRQAGGSCGRIPPLPGPEGGRT